VTDFRRAALVIAHPGHELRVHRWLELARPMVFVLTDGSGHSGRSRLAATSAVLLASGAWPGSIYGRLPDRELYRALLDGRLDLFASLAEELAEALHRESIELVAGDAVEGFNPGHDICRLLINAAVARLRANGEPIDNRDYPLEGAPGVLSGEERATAIRIELDAAALVRKIDAARSYPGLEDEVARTLARHGAQIFKTEWLREVRYGLDIDHLLPAPPFYEVYGEQQVTAGFYHEVLRFRAHVAPVAEHLRAQVPPRVAQGGAQ
jgi:hypothetical protein